MIKQRIETLGRRIPDMRLENGMKAIRKLLKRHILQLPTDIQGKVTRVLGRRGVAALDLVLGEGEVLGRRLHGFHEEAEDEKGGGAGGPIAAVLGLEGLGEEVEDVVHFAHDELVEDGFDLAGEDAGGDPGGVLGDEAGGLEGEDGFVGEA